MARGTLKSNFNDRGFTFVAIAGSSDDVFLHITQLRKGEDAQRYVRGAQVELDIVTVNVAGSTKVQGRDARLLSAAPISSALGRATGRVKFFQATAS
jgi:cold shock CspA family protein